MSTKKICLKSTLNVASEIYEFYEFYVPKGSRHTTKSLLFICMHEVLLNMEGKKTEFKFNFFWQRLQTLSMKPDREHRKTMLYTRELQDIIYTDKTFAHVG